MQVRPSISRSVLAALSLSLLASTGAAAQSGFLFDQPNVTLGARAGLGIASASSDLFEFTSEELTVNRSDFNGISLAGDAGIMLMPRLDLVVSAGYTGTSIESDSRGFVGEDDLPIRQTTEYQRVPLTVGLKFFPLARGRSIGSYAWIPARVVPYLGGGAGGMWYRFHQMGEFVDEESLDIFDDVFESKGWTPTAEAFGGLEFAVTPRISINGEGRYTWARAELSEAFEGFDPIDLAGISVTVGASFRY